MMRRESLLAALVVAVGCTSSPDEPTATATGQVTVDGIELASGSGHAIAFSEMLAVELQPEIGEPCYVSIEWSPTTATTIDLAGSSVAALLTVGAGSAMYDVMSGMWTPVCTSGSCTTPSALTGHASGSMTVDLAGDRYTGTFDLMLTWQDSNRANHAATATITYDNVELTAH